MLRAKDGLYRKVILGHYTHRRAIFHPHEDGVENLAGENTIFNVGASNK